MCVLFSHPSTGALQLIQDERLIAAAKTDNEDLYESAVSQVDHVNFADGWVLNNGAIDFNQ